MDRFFWNARKKLSKYPEKQLDEYDVIVIGSGAAGMIAALTARKHGLEVVIIEKSEHFGGTLALSGGSIWGANSSVILKAGIPDSAELASIYLSNFIGPEVPLELYQAYLEQGPKMIDFLIDNTPLDFFHVEGYSDYSSELPGGLEISRTIESILFDSNRLGPERHRINPPYIPCPRTIVIYSGEYRTLVLAGIRVTGITTALKCALRSLKATILGQKPLTMGAGLAAGLRLGLMEAQVPIWYNSPMIELVQENNTVSGVVIEQNGVRRTIRARKGVILGSGGFDHNIEMRKEYQQQLVSSHSSLGARDNTGDGICAGLKIGAATNFMDESWWVPIIPLPDGPYFCISERTLPGSLMVNKHGMRFVNEAAQSCHIINMMYEQDRSEDGSEIPIWMIADQVFRDRYLFRTIPGRFPLPKKWYDAGVVKKSNSLQELAQEIRLPVDTLQTTVENFNEYAKNGVDLDFGRGGYAVNHVYGDPGNKPNSTLGPLRKGPFYAFKMVSGDFGTRGGIVTDANARALRSDGTVIKGLWAAGTTSSPAIGRAYPGPGTPIRSSLTSGYIAGNSIADS